MTDTCAFEEPNSLKACLQLFAKLKTFKSLEASVIEKLTTQVNEYCRSDSIHRYMSNFSGDSNGYLHETFLFVNQLLGKFFSHSSNEYGIYTSVNLQCSQRIVDAITVILPKIFTALYYLYYQVSPECSVILGGKWSDYRLNSKTKKDLNLWLTDQCSENLIARGFSQEELQKSTNSANTIAVILKKLVGYSQAGPLQKALGGLLFFGDWDHGKLGHALLFLYELCFQVTSAVETTFRPRFEALNMPGTYDSFKKLCANLKSELTKFVKSGDSCLYAVCQRNNTNLYTNIVQATEKLTKYIDWLRKDLSSIMTALSLMSTEACNWTVENLKNASSTGPFKYGFVFKDGWTGTNSIHFNLKSHTSKLIASLQCLYCFLHPYTLKDCLHLFGQLHNLKTLKSKVLQNFKVKLQPYCGSDSQYMNDFVSEHLYMTLQTSDWILTTLLGTIACIQHKYLQDSDKNHDDCVEMAVEIIIVNLPDYYATLYYLYFNIQWDCNDIKGGGWNSDRLASKGHLYKWLTDNTGPTPGLLNPGFQAHQLSKSSAQTLSDQLKHAIDTFEAKALQKTLIGMIFICHWSDNLTGHALSFMYGFCSYVIKAGETNTLTSQLQKINLPRIFGTLKSVCIKLKTSIGTFVGSTSKDLCAVCQVNGNLYNDILDDRNFKGYVDWIKQNLDNIKRSLSSMLMDSAEWRVEKLKEGSLAGPFKYGFVFHNSWDGKPLKENLQNPITKLLSSLGALSHTLDPIFTAIVEGVISTAALGTAFLDTTFKTFKREAGETGQEEPVKDQEEYLAEQDRLESPNTETTLQPEAQRGETQTGLSSNTSVGPEATPDSSCRFKEPTTLKACLQLFGKCKMFLNSRLLSALHSKLQPYCRGKYLNQFGNKFGERTFSTLNDPDMLLALIIGKSDYGDYNSLDNDEDCVQIYIDTIIALLPKMFATLYFLYFNVSVDCKDIKGGEWNGYSVNDTTQALNKWLTDQHISNLDIQTGSDSTGLLQRGFGDECFSFQTGASVAAAGIKDLVQHSSPGSIQRALVPMLFICPWDHALTGHAFLFLKSFCDAVCTDHYDEMEEDNEDEDDTDVTFKVQLQEGKLHVTVKAFKDVCSAMSSNLDRFIDNAEVIYAVCQKDNENLYENVLMDEAFDKYGDWLRDNLDNLTSSLEEMLSDCTNWSTTTLKSAQSAGPFKYGLVFKSSDWENGFKEKFQGAIESLTDSAPGSLQSLLKALEVLRTKDTGNSSNTTIIATVGSTVVGAAGLSVAYAYNIWGFATLIQSIFAPLI